MLIPSPSRSVEGELPPRPLHYPSPIPSLTLLKPLTPALLFLNRGGGLSRPKIRNDEAKKANDIQAKETQIRKSENYVVVFWGY